MKNLLFLLALACLHIQCEKEATPLPDIPTEEETVINLTPETTLEETPSTVDKYADSYFLIDTIREDVYGSRPDIETIFSYDRSNRLIRANWYSNYQRIFTYEYDENSRLKKKVKETVISNDYYKIRWDSITYNEQGQIDKIYDFYDRDSSDDLDTFTINIIYRHRYDALGQLSQVDRYYYQYDDWEISYRLYWQDGNIVQMGRYSDLGVSVSFKYTYDEQPNYFRNHPHYYSYWLSYSKNNVKLSSATDYSGLYDPSCHECEYEYEYDAEGRVTFSKLLLFYRPPRHYISYK